MLLKQIQKKTRRIAAFFTLSALILCASPQAFAENSQTFTPEYNHSISTGLFFHADSNFFLPDAGIYLGYAYRLAPRYRIGIEVSNSVLFIPPNDIIRAVNTHEFDLYQSKVFILSLRADVGYYASYYHPCRYDTFCDKSQMGDNHKESYYHSFDAAANLGLAWWISTHWMVKLMLGVEGWIGTSSYGNGIDDPVMGIGGMLRIGFEAHL